MQKEDSASTVPRLVFFAISFDRIRPLRRPEIVIEAQAGRKEGKAGFPSGVQPEVHRIDRAEYLRRSEGAVSDTVRVNLHQVVLPVGLSIDRVVDPFMIHRRKAVKDGV